MTGVKSPLKRSNQLVRRQCGDVRRGLGVVHRGLEYPRRIRLWFRVALTEHGAHAPLEEVILPPEVEY